MSKLSIVAKAEDQSSSTSRAVSTVCCNRVGREKAYQRAVQDLVLDKADLSIEVENLRSEVVRVREQLALAKRRIVEIQAQNLQDKGKIGSITRILQQLDETVADM